MADQMMTRAGLAEFLGIPRNTVGNWARLGKIQATMRRANGYRYYSQSQADKIREQLLVKPRPKSN